MRKKRKCEIECVVNDCNGETGGIWVFEVQYSNLDWPYYITLNSMVDSGGWISIETRTIAVKEIVKQVQDMFNDGRIRYDEIEKKFVDMFIEANKKKNILIG